MVSETSVFLPPDQQKELSVDVLLEQAAAFRAAGKPAMAVDAVARAVVTAPDREDIRHLFSALIQEGKVPPRTEDYKRALEICLRDDVLRKYPLMLPWTSFLLRAPEYRIFRRIAACAGYDEFARGMTITDFEHLLSDPLLLAGLPVLHALDPALEKALTLLRRFCLMHDPLSIPLDFLSALALHCFLNEYVFYEDDAEKTRCAALRESLESADPAAEETRKMAALFGCYGPLSSLKAAPEILKAGQGAGHALYAALIRRQIEEPLREAALKRSIPALTPIRDSVSGSVREQYEENPYPRWLSIPKDTQGSGDPRYGLGKDILNAGCGTGQAPISTAVIYPGADITAIDLSLASLAYARRKAEEMGLGAITFAQADILELRTWDRTFDIVMCNGVLHHMNDPMEGWRVLCGLLKPGGAMFISLYSEAGRQAVVAARNHVAQHEIHPSKDGIRHFRQHVFSCGADHPLKPLAGLLDFYALSSCRDLVFHVMEHRFTCPRIQAALDDLGLRFIGFDRLSPEIIALYRDGFPDDPAMLNLANWDALERRYPGLFTNMYNFWCCRKDENPEENLPYWMTAD